MKTPNDKLFKLIKSLDSQEKRLISLALKNNKEDSSLLYVFTSLEKEEELDNEALSMRLKKQGITKENIKYKRRDLYEFVLNKLVDFHKKDTLEEELTTRLLQAKVLHNKLLLSEAQKIIKEVKEKSIANEFYLITFDAVLLELKLSFNLDFTEEIYAAANANYDLLKQNLKHFETFISARIFSSMVFNVYVEGSFSFNIKSHESVLALKKHPFFLLDTSGLKGDTLTNYYSSKVFVYVMLANWAEVFSYQKKLVETIKKSENITAKAAYFLISNSNLYQACLQVGAFDEATRIFNEAMLFYESLPKKTLNHAVKKGKGFLLIRSNYFKPFYEKKFDAIIQLIEKETHFEYFKYVNTFLINALYTYSAISYLVKGLPKKALYWLNRIIENQNKGGDIKQDVITYTKILQFIIHLELGNFDLTESFLRTFSNKYKTKDDYRTGFFILLKTFYNNYTTANSSEEQKISLIHFKNELLALSKNNFFVKILLWEIDLISWINSKTGVKNSFAQYQLI